MQHCVYIARCRICLNESKICTGDETKARILIIERNVVTTTSPSHSFRDSELLTALCTPHHESRMEQKPYDVPHKALFFFNNHTPGDIMGTYR